MANRFHSVTNNTTDADASDVNQFTQAFDNTPGEGKPLDMTQLDEDRFYVVVKNLNATSKVLQLLKNDGTVLFEAKGTGCRISPDGAAAGVPVTLGGRDASHYDATQVSTSSTSYVDAGSGVNKSEVTLTTHGGNVVVLFSCSASTGASTPGQRGQFGLKVDSGADIDLTKAQPHESGGYDAVAFVHRVTGLAAGSHTFTVRLKAITVGSFRAEDRSLVVLEV